MTKWNLGISRSLWLAVAGGLIMGLALGTRHMQGLFLVPVTEDHGWSREVFGLAIALQNLVWGAAQPLTGMIADRFGSARVIWIAAVAYAAGLCLMTVSVTPVAFNLSAGLLVGVALSGTAFGAVYGAISRLVAPAQRSRALGMAGAIGGLGQFLMVPMAQGMIGDFGWTTALLVFAAAFLVLSPLAFVLNDKPDGSNVLGSARSLRVAVGEAFAHRGFWLLNLGFLVCGFQLAFIATHLPAYLVDRDLGAGEGSAALALIALANVVGTYACGYLGGLYRRKHLLSYIYLLRSGAIALFILLPASSLSVYSFSLVMGLVWLGTVPLTQGLVSQVFGVRYVATLFGFVFLSHQVGSFFGVWLGSYVFEATGSYGPIWTGAILLGLLAAVLHWPIDDNEIVRERPAQAAP